MMSICSWSQPAVLLSTIALVVFNVSTSAQLAITEVMSLSSITDGTNAIPAMPDYWELTNFGNDPIDLTGYGVADRGGFSRRHETSFAGVTIQPRESIIFLFLDTGDVFDGQAFSNRWGGAFSNRVVLQETGFGVSAAGEQLSLWDNTGSLADSVYVPRVADRGISFSYNPVTGDLNWPSQIGECGAWKAANADDIGSPGVTCGVVLLSIAKQPEAQIIDAGLTARLCVTALGVPRPKYQWFFQNQPLPQATGAVYYVENVIPQNQGDYYVVIANGLRSLTSVVATLTVNTTPVAPQVVSPPTSIERFEGQAAEFTVICRGYPLPMYQWRFNGVDIPGANASTYLIANVNPSLAGTYSVYIENELGSATTNATLRVPLIPRLRVTEVMTDPDPGGLGAEYWELTNEDINIVDITGYKFFDHLVPEAGLVISNTVRIHPGESVIFVVQLTREEFFEWWGATNLPSDLQVITYRGIGLRPQEGIFLWNGPAKELDQPVAAATWDAACPGYSFRFPIESGLEECNVEGQYGAFRSPRGGDVGSPGYETTPRIISVTRWNNEVRLRCLVVPGRRYRLEYNSSMSSNGWLSLQDVQPQGFTFTATNIVPNSVKARFYRLTEL